MKKSWVIGLISVLILSFLALGIQSKRQSAKVKQIEVVEGPVVEAIYGIGKVEAVRRYQAKSGVPSGIMRLPIREGETVKAGTSWLPSLAAAQAQNTPRSRASPHR